MKTHINLMYHFLLALSNRSKIYLKMKKCKITLSTVFTDKSEFQFFRMKLEYYLFGKFCFSSKNIKIYNQPTDVHHKYRY